jgi:parvulin-like peptidyl-prolyl isomerase
MANQTNSGSQKPGTPERKKPETPATQQNKPGAKPGTSAQPGAKPGTGTPTRPGANQPIRPARPTGTGTGTATARRQSSKYEQDIQRQKWLVWATMGVIAFIVLVIGIGVWVSVIAPNLQNVAQVGNRSISRADYDKHRKIELFKQAGQIQQQLAFTQGDQATQLQSQLAFIQDEVANISSREVNQQSLEAMVNNIVLVEAARSEFGINVDDNQVNTYLSDEFKGAINTPTPNATQAGRNERETAVATQRVGIQTVTAQAITPLPTPTPTITETAATSPTATVSTTPTSTTSLTPAPTNAASPAATTTVTAAATVSGTTAPTATTTVSATATPLPTATSTPVPANQLQGTAKANEDEFLRGFRRFTGLSNDDYKQYEARPALVKRQVVDRLRDRLPKLGDPYPQTRVSHILFKVEDEAKARETYEELRKFPADQLEANFVRIARERSTDTAASTQNGDLGWLTDKTPFDKTFLDAALALQKGQLREPLKTQFGWHIMYATDKDDKRPLDALTIEPFSSQNQLGDPVFFEDWLKEKTKNFNIRYNTPPTPAPTQTPLPVAPFTPVIPPTVTPVPTATPVVTATTAAVTGTVTAGTPGATTAAAGTPGATTAAATTPSATTIVPTTAVATTTAAVTTSAATTPAVTTASATTAAPSGTPTP